jgi:glutamate synthase domain-containing protein 1
MEKEGQVRIPSGCAISGVISKKGEMIGGGEIVKSIRVMHERSNGLGGGFAGYGIYPNFKDWYAFHVFYENLSAKEEGDTYLRRHFEIVEAGEIRVKRLDAITDIPLIWRYFIKPLPLKLEESLVDEPEFVIRAVMHINAEIPGAFVFSSGKNMGVFKAVGYPEDVGVFFRLEEYEGYCWTSHGRYPTNTPGWWGGAHPFALLDYTVVHNGEISSYNANQRFIEMHGYKCTLQTDTEVITYIIDYLVRRLGMTMTEAASVIAAPFWTTIERLPEPQRSRLTYLRSAFSSLLVTGPFSILLGFDGGLMALNDRLKLRSMVVGEKGSRVYIASEEAAIRAIEPDLEKVWAPRGGQPVIVTLEGRTV